MKHHSQLKSLIAISLCVLFPYLLLDLWLAWNQIGICRIAPREWGNDFHFFYRASQSLWMSTDPYSDWFFTSPPLAAFVSLPLINFTFDTAFPIFSIISILAVFLGIWILSRRLFTENPKCSYLMLLLILLAGFPFQFLISRGNIEAIVFLFIAIALFLLPRYEFCGGMLFGVAASLKLYPLLLLAPLCLFRKKKAIIGMLCATGVCAFLTYPHWSAFLVRLMSRSQEFRFDENASFAAAIFFLFSKLSGTNWTLVFKLPELVFVLLLSCQLLVDLRLGIPKSGSETTARLCLYFPLMVSVPNLVFNYELIFVVATVPAILWLWKVKLCWDWKSLILPLMLLAVAMTQFQSVLFFSMTQLPVAHFIPAFGLLLLAILIPLNLRVCGLSIIKSTLESNAGAVSRESLK